MEHRTQSMGVALALALLACKAPAVDSDLPDPTPTPTDTGDSDVPLPAEVAVVVTLDGVPVEGAWVGIGGGPHTTTDADGRASLPRAGDTVIASHPEARTRSAGADDAEVAIALQRFSTADNPAYVFQDPGVPGDPGTTAQCGHCHGSMVTDWAASPHRGAASNPVVQDVFAGTASIATETACAAAGGAWWTGIGPGTGAPADRCYLGAGALPDLDGTCGDTGPCDAVATDPAGCADCHAPGIDGALGGRSLLEATGRAYTEGIHCDVCHKVEGVDLAAGPGVGGALRIVRPSEPGTPPLDLWQNLMFGPFPDVPNPRMGAVQRDLFREAELCAACHELVQPARVPGTALDPARWPDGLPVHSTYSEWLEGPYAPASPCQSCHMPPDPRWGNSADLTPDTPLLGVAAGWWRPPGSVRRHTWDGPRGTGDLLGLAAALDLQISVSGGVAEIEVTTTNVGAGHALPTGEPYRTVLLVVEARCGAAVLDPVGGDVVPAFGGALDTKAAGEDWAVWPGAAVGERIRVVSRTGWRDYTGPGPFGDGTFAADAKGLPAEAWVDDAAIVAVAGDVVTLEHPLAAGDIAYRVDGVGLPQPGEASRARAGAPGFAFARVLADADGALQVPHHRAVDVVSDNRLLPLAPVTTTHRFASPCTDPTATARLVHRPLPVVEARLRSWDAHDQLLAEATR